MGQATSTGSPKTTMTMPQSPTSPPITMNIRNSTSGTLYIDVDSTSSGAKPLTLASGKTGIVYGVCNACSVLVFKDAQRTQVLVAIPYKTYLDESQGKSQPLVDIGFSSKIVDAGTFIPSSQTSSMMNTTPMNMNAPVFTTPMSTTPSAFVPRPAINTTPVGPMNTSMATTTKR